MIRTVLRLRYLSDGPLRRRVTAATNKVEAFNGFSQWLGFGNRGVIADDCDSEGDAGARVGAVMLPARAAGVRLARQS
ncbi:hypothetical protein GCM10010191_66110 [Actinomadura vinacea]|uniref:Tn3 transposase DDE domain-containing protein n=1 Tax=Actinomadura vinacea TaxID=115336 RepID=A0ABP5WZJ3_9ACTN